MEIGRDIISNTILRTPPQQINISNMFWLLIIIQMKQVEKVFNFLIFFTPPQTHTIISIGFHVSILPRTHSLIIATIYFLKKCKVCDSSWFKCFRMFSLNEHAFLNLCIKVLSLLNSVHML